MDWDGLDGLDLCAGLLYEHRFAMLIIWFICICICGSCSVVTWTTLVVASGGWHPRGANQKLQAAQIATRTSKLGQLISAKVIYKATY